MSWNYRVVRRYKVTPEAFKELYGPEQSWIEIAEVYYKDGAPHGFASHIHPFAPVEPEDGVTTEQALESAKNDLRWSLEHMLLALDKPVLDARKDLHADESDAPTPCAPANDAQAEGRSEPTLPGLELPVLDEREGDGVL